MITIGTLRAYVYAYLRAHLENVLAGMRKDGLLGKNAGGKQGFDFFFGYNCQRQAHTYYPVHLWRNREKVLLSNPLVAPHVELGDDVDEGQELLILEAMKMENCITAPAAGKVKTIHAREGESVPESHVLLVLE